MLNKIKILAQQPSNLVAIVVPLGSQAELTQDEKISFRHLTHYLGNYDKYLVVPQSLPVSYSGFGIKWFDDTFFGSAKAHNKLLLSPHFYEAFKDYKFILIYHLDALVFSDQLEEWCAMDFDYIGAPWIAYEGMPYSPQQATKVGNGGFSLRKVSSFLKVFFSPEYYIDPNNYWETNYASKPKHIQFLNWPKKLLMHMSMYNNSRMEMSRFKHNEELFWAHRAVHYYPDFNIAPYEIALRFAFECAPQLCFEQNNYEMPFGCHAWPKYDRAFWESYLLKNEDLVSV